MHLESALPYVNTQRIIWKYNFSYNACEGGHYIFVKPIIIFSHDTQWVSDGYPLGIKEIFYMKNHLLVMAWGWALQESGQHLGPSLKALIPVKPLSAWPCLVRTGRILLVYVEGA